MRWPETAIAAALQYRQQVEESNSTTTTEEVDLFPYSGLQHIGFFILFFFPSIALVIVTLRIWSRVVNKQFGWDDALITTVMALSIAETGASYMGMRTAYLGVHVYDIPPTADLMLGMKWNYILQLLYNPILALVKSSVLLFLLRLGGHKRGVRYTIHALNAFNIALMIGIFVTVIFQCTPITFFWNRASGEGSCVDTGAFYVATAALTILTDVLVLVLPFWIFIGLKMPSKVKIALLVVFMVGGIVTVISILRLVWLIEISFGTGGEDPTYDIRFTYSAVETNLAIMCASAPALRGLVIKWFPRFFSSLGYGSQKYKSGENGYNKYGTGGGLSPGYANGTGNKSAIGHAKSYHKATNERGTFQLQDIKHGGHVKSMSTNSSEEEIMTYDGIMRTTEVNVVYGDKGMTGGSGSGSTTRSPSMNGPGAHPPQGPEGNGPGTKFGYAE